MRLIHTRASKKRDKAAARLLTDQARAAEHGAPQVQHDERTERLADQREAAQGKSRWRQPKLGEATRASREK
jgi:hypothetical protein